MAPRTVSIQGDRGSTPPSKSWGEGHERYFGCNLMHCKVLASSHQHLMAEAPKVRVLAQDGAEFWHRTGPAEIDVAETQQVLDVQSSIEQVLFVCVEPAVRMAYEKVLGQESAG